MVLVSHVGRFFCARVTGLERFGVLAIESLDRRVSYRSAKAREVVDHWAHARGDRDERPSREQLQLEVVG